MCSKFNFHSSSYFLKSFAAKVFFFFTFMKIYTLFKWQFFFFWHHLIGKQNLNENVTQATHYINNVVNIIFSYQTNSLVFRGISFFEISFVNLFSFSMKNTINRTLFKHINWIIYFETFKSIFKSDPTQITYKYYLVIAIG